MASIHTRPGANSLAERLFNAAAISVPPPEATRTAATQFRVVADFVPALNGQQANLQHVASGEVLKCTSERWLLAQRAHTNTGLSMLVPETHVEEIPPDGQRYKVTLELIETEEAYNDSIGLLFETMVQPLERGAILPAPTIKRIFSSSEQLFRASKDLALALRLRLRDGWDEASTCVGDVLCGAINASDSLLGQSRFVDAYVQFINGFEQSQRALHGIEDKPEWLAFLKHWALLVHATGRSKAPPDLQSLLVKPVQRVPRFKLLLEQLLKATPMGHPDRASTESALRDFSELASSVNEAIRRREQVEAVYQLQNEFGGAGTEKLPKEGRYLLKRADGVQVGWPPRGSLQAAAAETTKPKTLVLLLFSDALLLAERNTFGAKLSLFHWFLPEAAGRALPGEPEGTLHLVRKASSGGADETLSFCISPPAEADEWLDHLRRLCHSRAAGKGAGPPGAASFSRRGGGGGVSERSVSAFGGGGIGGGIGSGSFAGAGGAAGASAAGGKAARAPGLGQGVLAGWLQKKGGGGADGTARNWAKGGRRNWKWRWVVVTNNQFISWFDSEKAKEHKGALALIGAQVSKSERPGGFWILTNNRSLELMADSEEKAARWVAVLQETANKLPSLKESMLHDEGTAEEEARAAYAPPPPPPPQPPPPQPPPPPPGPPCVQVIWDYIAQREDDLTIRRGDVVEVVEMEGDWWVGTVDGRYGAFPSNYTQLLPQGQQPHPPPGLSRGLHEHSGSSLVSDYL